MKTNVTNPNKKVFRVILAAAAVLILCGAFCGAAAATDLTANLSTNSIVEKVTIHNVDTSQGQMYGLNLTASSRLWEDSDVEMMMKSDLYIKPFKLEITCNSAILEKVNLTIQFKVNETKMNEYAGSGKYQVRLAHKISDKTWELLKAEPVTSVPSDGNLHYNVTAQEPTPLFAIVVMKETVTGVDPDGWATLGEDGKMTIISSASSIASDVKLTAVSGLNTEGNDLSFNKLSGNNPLLIASLENHKLPKGYISQKIISLFAVETTKPNVKNPVMHMDVTVKDGYTPDNVKVIHFKNGKWEDNYLSSTHSGNTYEVTTDGFSPFAVVYAVPEEKPTPEPTPQKSSSRDYGASVWLPATTEPTAEPTAEPTLAQPASSPIDQPASQASTPVPAAGILAGLAAAAVMALRRR